MGNYHKWGEVLTLHPNPKKPIYVYLMVSRPKDNKAVPNFTSRHVAFLANDLSENPTLIWGRFNDFIAAGVENETCRLYRSVNARDLRKTKKQFISRMLDDLDNDNSNLNLNMIFLKIAAQKENAIEHKWLLDFDGIDEFKFSDIISEVQNYFVSDSIKFDSSQVEAYKTLSGLHIITPRGFDTRTLIKEYGDSLSVKKDDLRLIAYNSNNVINEMEKL